MGETEIGAVGFAGLVVGLVAVVALRWALRGADDAEADEWSNAHGLTLTSGNRRVVVRYLSRVKRLRRVGGLTGMVVPVLMGGLLGLIGVQTWSEADDQLWTFGPFWVLTGYTVGIVVAELSFARRSGSGEGAGRAASLVPRELPAYLPQGMVVALRSLALVCLVLVPVYLAAPRTGGGSLVPSGPLYLLTGLSGLVVAGSVEAVVRWVVRRPQPVTSDDLLAADDAIRASSAHALAGAGIGLVLLTQAALWAAMSATDVAGLRSVSSYLALACLLGVIVSCFYYGNRAWRVRSRDGITAQP